VIHACYIIGRNTNNEPKRSSSFDNRSNTTSEQVSNPNEVTAYERWEYARAPPFAAAPAPGHMMIRNDLHDDQTVMNEAIPAYPTNSIKRGIIEKA